MTKNTIQIIKQSLKIAWQYKWLWVIAILLNTGSGLNYNGPSGSSSDKSETENSTIIEETNDSQEMGVTSLTGYDTLQKEIDQTNTDVTVQNLDKSETPDPFAALKELPQSVKNLLDTLSPEMAVVAVLAILIALLIGIVFWIFVNSWAQSALIWGSSEATEGRAATLGQQTINGFKHVKEMIKLSIFPMLIFDAIAMAASILFVIILLVTAKGVETSGIITLILVLLSIALILALLFGTIVLAAGVGYGKYAIVLKNLKWKEAFKEGWNTFKHNVKATFLLIFGNCLVNMGFFMGISLVAVIIAGIAGGSAVLPFVNEKMIYLSIITFPVAALCVLGIIFGASIVKSFVTVYSTTTWVILFKQLHNLMPKDAETSTLSETKEVK